MQNLQSVWHISTHGQVPQHSRGIVLRIDWAPLYIPTWTRTQWITMLWQAARPATQRTCMFTRQEVSSAEGVYRL